MMGIATSVEFLRDASAAVLHGADLLTETGHAKQIKSANITIVDARSLQADCLGRGLIDHNPALSISNVRSLDALRGMPNRADASAILVVLPQKMSDHNVRTELSNFVTECGETPVIVVADSDAPTDIIAALESGVRGYVPTNVKAKVVAEAIELARAGGIFVPASGFLAFRDLICAAKNKTDELPALLTTRQAAVADALRKGKANKIIAYELGLCESTVKVHVRAIMKKVNATNRTQVALKLGEMAA